MLQVRGHKQGSQRHQSGNYRASTLWKVREAEEKGDSRPPLLDEDWHAIGQVIYKGAEGAEWKNLYFKFFAVTLYSLHGDRGFWDRGCIWQQRHKEFGLSAVSGGIWTVAACIWLCLLSPVKQIGSQTTFLENTISHLLPATKCVSFFSLLYGFDPMLHRRL